MIRIAFTTVKEHTDIVNILVAASKDARGVYEKISTLFDERDG